MYGIECFIHRPVPFTPPKKGPCAWGGLFSEMLSLLPRHRVQSPKTPLGYPVMFSIFHSPTCLLSQRNPGTLSTTHTAPCTPACLLLPSLLPAEKNRKGLCDHRFIFLHSLFLCLERVSCWCRFGWHRPTPGTMVPPRGCSRTNPPTTMLLFLAPLGEKLEIFVP